MEPRTGDPIGGAAAAARSPPPPRNYAAPPRHPRGRADPKILLVNSLYHPQEIGGAECAVRLLSEGLVGRGFDVTVACLSPTGREERELIHGVQVVRLPLANFYWPFSGRESPVGPWRRAFWHVVDGYNTAMGARLGRILDETRPDLVHLNNLAGFSVAVLAAAKRRHLPVVQTVHDYYYTCPRTSMFRGGANCARQCGSCRALAALRMRMGRRVDMVCGVSGAMLRRIEDCGAFRGTPGRAVVRSANLPSDAVPARRRDRRAGEGLTVGFLGRLDPTKGVETLLNALRVLRGLPLEVVIAGRGQPAYEAELRRKAEGLPARFLGHVDPKAMLSEIDVLVVPSLWHEPFGRVVQEAFSYGVPVIGSETGGIPEAIGPDGPGFLFPPGDVDRLAAILRGLVVQGLPAEELSEACLARSAKFALDTVVDEHIQLYQQVLGGGAMATA